MLKMVHFIMGNETCQVNSNFFLLNGPVNSALYNLGQGNVYTINPLTLEALNGGEHNGVPPRPQSIGKEAREIINGYLTRHPALTELSNSRNNTGLPEETVRAFSYPSGPFGLDFMWLELTESCNLSCAHCYAETGTDCRNELSPEQWRHILAEGARLGAKQVQFTGGEPTLHPGLMELIEYARSLRYADIEIFTNATRLDDGLLQRWKDLGVNVALSFYSYDPETHDRITGKHGSFRQTVQGIKAILSYNIPVRVAVILMKENLPHRERTLEFLKGLGLKEGEIEWDTVRPTGRGIAGAAFLEGDAGVETALFGPPSPLAENQGTCGVGFVQGTCWKGRIAISSKGEVYPCIFARQCLAGKFPETGLEKIVQGEGLQRLWRITLEDVETCKDCELRYGCFDCRALALSVTGNLFSKNQRCGYNPYTGLVENNGVQRMGERPKRRTDIINEEIDDEVVIYDPKSHNVHHLNPMAGVIWNLCDGRHTAKKIAGEIVASLKADPSQVEADVAKIIEEFRGKGLLEKVSR